MKREAGGKLPNTFYRTLVPLPGKDKTKENYRLIVYTNIDSKLF